MNQIKDGDVQPASETRRPFDTVSTMPEVFRSSLYTAILDVVSNSMAGALQEYCNYMVLHGEPIAVERAKKQFELWKRVDERIEGGLKGLLNPEHSDFYADWAKFVDSIEHYPNRYCSVIWDMLDNKVNEARRFLADNIVIYGESYSDRDADLNTLSHWLESKTAFVHILTIKQ